LALLTRKRTNHGTTLAELMIAIVVASIVAISFSSVAMYTQNMYNSSRIRSQLSQDAFIIDRYVRKNLTLQIADSMKIFASAADEVTNITASSGTILRSVRPDSTVDHVALSAGTLLWEVDSNSHFPIDSEVSGILFTRRTGFSKTLLDINIDLIAGEDSLPLAWLVAIRN
jgi:Tfp pilus assembly protein PilE